MKISFITLLIFNLLLIAVLLPTAGSRAEIDANKLIESLQTRYGKMKGLSADFTQIFHDRAGRQLREQGTLILKKPGRMRWEYRQPEQKLFIADGKSVYFYVPAEKQVTIAPIKETDDPRAPFVFLLGHVNLGRVFSAITISQSESPTVAGNVVLEFVPKRVTNTLKRLYAEVSPEKLQLNRLVLINGAGARSDFLLTNFRENFIADDEQFTFVPPPGVTVLR
jgi:outer membrane lipoprotein carrier protein